MGNFIKRYYIEKKAFNRFDIKNRVFIYGLPMKEYFSEAEHWLDEGEHYVKYEDLDDKIKKRLNRTIESVSNKKNVKIMTNPPAYVFFADEETDPEVKICLQFIARQ